MPRIRSVHPDICHDDAVAGLSSYAFRTWVLLWTHLDDEGRGLDNAKLWAGLLYPLNDKMTSERVERDLAELEASNLLVRYEVDGRRYLSAKPESWKQRQRPQKPTPSKLPPVPTTRPPTGDAVRPVAHGTGTGTGTETEQEGGSGGEPSGAKAPAAVKAREIAARNANREVEPCLSSRQLKAVGG